MAVEALYPVQRPTNGREPRPEQKKKMLQIYSKEPSNAYGTRQDLVHGRSVHKGRLSTKFVRKKHK